MASNIQADGADLVILQALRTAEEGVYVSGSELAELLGVSRAAVGKRVALLREQGWTIDAVPRLGYRLVEEPDSLHPLCVLGLLRTQVLGHIYRFVPEVESTNAELSRLAAEGMATGAVLVADHQRAGRGRLGRRW
ncbi:MAG: HTH domain-containing protein, partial [Deltaproteobacteria bacterium]|nr:HTH domain-containing protein [Deltaproteobacteria bacterium]